MVAKKSASAEPVDQFFAEITGIWRWFWSLPTHPYDSRLNLTKNLSPKPVDKFVDNVKKNFMPY